MKMVLFRKNRVDVLLRRPGQNALAERAEVQGTGQRYAAFFTVQHGYSLPGVKFVVNTTSSPIRASSRKNTRSVSRVR